MKICIDNKKRDAIASISLFAPTIIGNAAFYMLQPENQVVIFNLMLAGTGLAAFTVTHLVGMIGEWISSK